MPNRIPIPFEGLMSADAIYRFVIAIILSVLLCAYTRASEDNPQSSTSFKYGLGIIEGGPTTRVKAFGLRYEESLGALSIASEGGLWTDVGKAEGRSSSGYGAVQAGVRPQSDHVYVKAFLGPCIITSRDSLLGGFFPQWKFDTGFGFQDKTSFIGINLSHTSSAGVYRVNKGRDFIQLETGTRF